jgi:hypothetical protein
MQQEVVREILRDAIDVTKELPSELRSVAFGRVLDLLSDSFSAQRAEAGASKAPDRVRERPKKEALGKPVRRSRNGSGPKQATVHAIENGFFDQPQTIETLAQHLKQDLVLTFNSQLLGTALARLVRDGRLGRKQNKEGRYEYHKI